MNVVRRLLGFLFAPIIVFWQILMIGLKGLLKWLLLWGLVMAGLVWATCSAI